MKDMFDFFDKLRSSKIIYIYQPTVGYILRAVTGAEFIAS